LVIARTLKALTRGALPDELDVVVVCNGCSDDTAAIARRFGELVRIIETALPNNAHALNLGDRAAVPSREFILTPMWWSHFLPFERSQSA